MATRHLYISVTFLHIHAEMLLYKCIVRRGAVYNALYYDMLYATCDMLYATH